MELVPSVDSMVVDARISPMDIDRVQIGQAAEIRFAVFKDAYSISGELVGLPRSANRRSKRRALLLGGNSDSR